MLVDCKAAGAAPTEEFTLRVISHREFSETLIKLLDTLDNEFESAHPGVTVQRDFMDFRQWEGISQLRLTSENPPDIFVANNGESGMGLMINGGLLLNLTPYAEKMMETMLKLEEEYLLELK